MESAAIPVSGAPGAPAPTATRPPRTTAFEEFGDFVRFSAEALRALPGSFRYFSEIARINATIVRRTTLLTFVMAGFLGASASNFGFFLLRSLGASDFVGIIPALLSARQIAPQSFAYVFAGSVCCGIAAELGSARIQQEIAAYESEGVDPMRFLIGPRILASLLFVPLAAMAALMGVLFGSYVVIVLVLHGNTAHQLLDSYFSINPLRNVLFSVITAAILTLQCVLVACFYGMRTSGGPDAVGGAIARSLAVNLVVLHILLAVIAMAFYGGGLGLPIGD